MTAFLKIDDCSICRKSFPWEWVPAVLLSGKPLAGTGVWRSQLIQGVCPPCEADRRTKYNKAKQELEKRAALVQLLGGEKPYREFTFERYRVSLENQLAYQRCKHFSPTTDNLYLWGPCGVGKTHLAWAIAQRCFEESFSVAIRQTGQLIRSVRMKEPAQEQQAIDELASAKVLVLDDFGTGPDTPYRQQVLQEVLDERVFNDRAGLVVTSSYSLGELAAKMGHDAIPSRLAGLCRVIRITGPDHRVHRLTT